MPGVDIIKEHERVFLIIEQTNGVINTASIEQNFRGLTIRRFARTGARYRKINKTIDLKQWIPTRFQNFLHSCKHRFLKRSVCFNQLLESYLIQYGFFEIFRLVHTNIDKPLHSSDNVVKLLQFPSVVHLMYRNL